MRPPDAFHAHLDECDHCRASSCFNLCQQGAALLAKAARATAPQPDEWYQGYACALAQIWHLHHDAQMIKHLMKHAGISIDHLVSACVEGLDIASIRDAMRRW